MATMLHAQPRKTYGKKVRFIRREGVIPANLYSRGTNSMALQLDVADMASLLSEQGTGGVVSLKLDNEKHPRNVVVRDVQRDALTGGLIHVDFQQVSMTDEIKVEVPVKLKGEAKLPKSVNAVVIQTVNTLILTCMPTQIPEALEIDISGLTQPGQAIHVKDLALEKGMEIQADPEEVLVKVVASRAEVEETVVAAAPGAAAPAEGEAEAED